MRTVRHGRRGSFLLALIILSGPCTATAAFGADRLAPDEMVAKKTSRPPVLDGELTDKAWQDAPRVTGFTDPATGGAPLRETWMKAAYDEANLYLAVWCAEPDPARLKARGEKDRNVWQDDCVEVFIRHTNEPGAYLQLITNTRDVHEDYQHLPSSSPGRKWDSGWETRAKVGQRAWTSEIRIPLAELGMDDAPVRGDYLALKLGRQIWSHLRPDMPATGGRLGLWPKGRTYSGSSGFGRLYFGARNLLVNPTFGATPNRQGFYPSWHGQPEDARHYTMTTENGERVVTIDAERGRAGAMWQNVRVRANDTYMVRAEVRGAVSGGLQVRIPVRDEERTVPIYTKGGGRADWQLVSLEFSSPGPQVSFCFSADQQAKGKKVSFRRLEIIKQGHGVQPYYLTWKIKEPLPRHGLDALAARRFGIKPCRLLSEKGCAGQERTVFRDTSTGTEIWLLTRDRANECHVYHSMWWTFSANGKWIDFGADRVEPKAPKHRRWAARTDGGAIVPTCTHRSQTYHWSARDGDIFYHDAAGDPGRLYELNVQTGERRVVTELGKWQWGCYGKLIRPGKWSDRLVLIKADNRTGITVKLDGTDRREVVFEPPEGKELIEPLFSRAHPNIILTAHRGVYRLASDGSISRVCTGSKARKAHGFQNAHPSHHGHTSPSELYKVNPKGDVTHPDGHVEKVYDPLPLRHLGGFIGNNGYATFGPTDDWFIIENGLHFVKVRLDGRSYAFLGFHLAMSLDYYSMAWGQPSPDGTKIVTKTTMFDNTDMMLMIAHRPLPPVNVRVVAHTLKWDPPRHHSEVKGYLIHAGPRSGGPYRQRNREPVTATSWPLPKGAAQAGHYVVTAIEHSGLASPYSEEIGIDIKGHAPLRLFAQAELLTMESPVVERRDVSASNWHYVAQDPYVRSKRKRDGKLVWQCRAPRGFDGRPLTLWLRARSESDAKQGLAKVLTAGVTEGKVVAAGRAWQWVRADTATGKPMPVRVAAGLAEVRIVPRTHALAIDMLALTSEPGDRPRGRGNADQIPPHAPARLTAAAAGPHEVFVKWTASPELDVAHYSVYAADNARVAPEQRMLVGSPREPRFVDWGLKPGTRYAYIVTAVDRAGNESAPSTAVLASTAAKATDRILLEAETAAREETGKGVSVAFLGQHESCSGGKFVGARLPGGKLGSPGTLSAETRRQMQDRLKMPAKRTSLSWRLNVRSPGEYVVWLRVRSRDKEVRPVFSVDGKELAKPKLKFGWYDARVAQSMWGDVAKAYRWFWTDVPLLLEPDARQLRVKLGAGAHVFTISGIRAGLDLDAVVLTSDYSWIPQGTLNYY